MNLSNSKLIIGAFQTVGKVLDGVSGIMEHIELQIPLFGTLALMAANSLGHKLREHEIAKQQYQLDLQTKQLAQEEAIAETEKAARQQATLEVDAAINAQKAKEKEAQLAYDQALMDAATAKTELEKAQNEELAAQQLENEIEMQIQNDIKAAQAEKQKALENEILAAKLQQKAANGELTAQEQAQLAQAKATAAEARTAQKTYQGKIKQGKKDLQTAKQLTKDAKQQTKTAKQNYNTAKKAAKQAAKNLKTEQDKTNQLINQRDTEIDTLTEKSLAENQQYQLQQKQLALLKEQTGETGLLAAATANVMAVLSAIPGVMSTIAAIQKIINFLKDKERIATLKATLATKKQMLAEKIKAAWSMAGSAGSIPYAGWIIAGAILAAILGMAIVGAIGGVKAGMLEFGGADKKREEAANEIKALGAEIYKLEESANNIDTLADSFENLGKKVIKSKEDVKAMEEDLAKLGETMEEEAPDDGKNASEYDKEMAAITGGKSEKEYYEGLTDEGKIEFARKKAELQRKEADRKRDEQLQVMNDLEGG